MTTATAPERAFQPDAVQPVVPERSAFQPGPVGVVVKRYEAIFALVAAAVVMIHLSGGSFVGSPLSAANSATPFDFGAGQAPALAAAPPGPPVVVPPAANVAPPALGGLQLAGPAPAPQVATADGGGSNDAAGPDTRTQRASAPAFADGGRFGTRAPFATVPGPGALTSVAAGPTGDVWVGIDETTQDAGKVQHLTAGGVGDRSLALPPEASGVTALTRAAKALFVGTATPAAVYRLDDVGSQLAKYAEIPNVTPCLPPVITTSCDGSFTDAAPRISALAADSQGNLYVADSAQGAIWLVKPDKSVAQFLVDPEWVSPATPSGPTGLAIDAAGNLVIAVASTRTDDVGAVFLQKITAGKAGERTQLATTGSSSRPAGVVLSRSGRMLVSLAGTGRVLVLDRTGKQAGQTPAAPTPALKAPSGLTFRGASLLVATNTTPGKAGQVVRLPVAETGGVTQ